MVKRFKKHIISVFALIAALCLFSNNVFAHDSLSEMIENEKDNSGEFEVVNGTKEDLNCSKNNEADDFGLYFKNLLFRSTKNRNEYMIVYRTISEPRQNRNWGILGMGSHGNDYFNHRVTTKITLGNDGNYKIKSYEPENWINRDKYLTQIVTNNMNDNRFESIHKYMLNGNGVSPVMRERQVLHGSLTFIKKNNIDEHENKIQQEVQFRNQAFIVNSNGLRDNFSIDCNAN